MDKLLRELNKQFGKHGISRIDQGVIEDASIVDSPYALDGSVDIEVAEDREDTRSQDALDLKRRPISMNSEVVSPVLIQRSVG